MSQPGTDAQPIPGAPGVVRTREGWRERFLVTKEYSNLWFAQVISAFGDWIGLFAITALASNISGEPEAATALVLTARVAPSFFLGPFMGVLVDRFDRRKLMILADIARAMVFVALPFVNSLWGLIFASFLLEVFTLMWSPAKEALVPHLVPRHGLTQANSLSVLAAYGTMPLAGVIQFLLAEGNHALAEVSLLAPLQFDRNLGGTQTLAFYFDALTFLATAFIVWRFVKVTARYEPISVPPDEPALERVAGEFAEAQQADVLVERPPRFARMRRTLHEIRDGWKFIWANPVVRAVNVGLAAGLLGGAMLVPLGPAFAKLVIGDTNSFSLYITALGFGVAAGVGLLTWLQSRLPKTRVFVAALFFAGVSISFGVSMSTFLLSAVGVFGLGLGAGAVYVLGFTLLQENTSDDLRGRTFTTFLTLVRLCVLGAMVLGPTISALLNPVMESLIDDRNAEGVPVIHAFGVEYAVPGVRVTLWLGGLLIIVASVLSARSINLKFRENLRSLGGDLRHRNGIPVEDGDGDDVGGADQDDDVHSGVQ